MKFRKKEIFHKMQDVIQSIFFQKFKNYKFVHFNKKFKFFEFLIAKQIKMNKEFFFLDIACNFIFPLIGY